ncbi:hypothetical protein MASR2M70_01400 [Bacillota bacterium]
MRKSTKEKYSTKERWIKENDLEQKLIVTYSIKYRDYHREIRNSQVERALKAINDKPLELKTQQNEATSVLSQNQVHQGWRICGNETSQLKQRTNRKRGNLRRILRCVY